MNKTERFRASEAEYGSELFNTFKDMESRIGIDCPGYTNVTTSRIKRHTMIVIKMLQHADTEILNMSPRKVLSTFSVVTSQSTKH